MATIQLASWERRFWAWLIDILIILILVNIISAPGALYRFIHIVSIPVDLFPLDLGLNSIILFLYWTGFEGYSGRSIGKIALDVRVTGRSGERIGFFEAAISSFGKAFLLPLDCLIGWLAMPGSRLRLFNRLSGTIVIKTPKELPEGIEYIKEEE